MIIKHKLCLSDEETVAQIQEKPYLQYFVGLAGYQMEAPFAPSLLVEIRKRMGQGVFEIFQGVIIDALWSGCHYCKWWRDWYVTSWHTTPGDGATVSDGNVLTF